METLHLLWTLVGAVAVQRVLELLYARSNGRRLAAAGARLVRDDGYLSIVLVHALWFLAFLAEPTMHEPRLGPWTYVALPLVAAGEGLRWSSMVALGPRWHTRVWVLPEAPLVRRGPYRFLRHPIYVGVTLTLVGLPLLFGLWWTALLVLPPQLWTLVRRIRREERALGLRRAPAP